MTENRITRQQQMKDLVEWKLKSDVEYTRKAIIERARWLAVRLTRLADGLEQRTWITPSTPSANYRATASSWIPGARSSASPATR